MTNAYLDNQGRRRVVLTGIGVISPIGNGRAEFWSALLEGKNGAAVVKSFDTSTFRSRIACEVKSFDYNASMAGANVRHVAVGRASQYAVAAAGMALKDGVLTNGSNFHDPTRIGVAVGTTMGEVQILHDIARSILNDEASGYGTFPSYVAHNLSTNLAKTFDLRGPNILVPNACASGNYAIGIGCDLIRTNRVDAMIVGGVDPIDSIVFAGFSRLFSVAPELCQPFDKNRKGILVGEGAGVFLLESLESALHRQAPIYCEVIGYGLSGDAFHMTNPHPDADGSILAAKAAFKDAQCPPDDVDCVIAHGTGTMANDKAETQLIKKIFGSRAYGIPITSNKSMLGHTMGAAAAMNAAQACCIFDTGYIPPTINYQCRDPLCDLDYVPNEKRDADVKVILSNAFAFGGNNSVVIFRKSEETIQ